PPGLLPPRVPPQERHLSPPPLSPPPPVLSLPLFVYKSVVGIVAENLGVLSRCPEARLKLAHRRGCAPIVPISEVSLQRDLDVCCLRYCLRRQSVEADRGGEFRHASRTQNCHRTTKTKPRQPDLDPRQLQKLRRATHNLIRRLEKIQRIHLPTGRFYVMIRHHHPGIEIRRQGLIAGQSQSVADAPDLL